MCANFISPFISHIKPWFGAGLIQNGIVLGNNPIQLIHLVKHFGVDTGNSSLETMFSQTRLAGSVATAPNPSPAYQALRFTRGRPLGCLASDFLILAVNASISLLWGRAGPGEVGVSKTWGAKQTLSFRVSPVPLHGINRGLLLLSTLMLSGSSPLGVAWWPKGPGTVDRARPLCGLA